MRREVVELANICSQKYVEDYIYNNKELNLHILGEIIKMQWISIIKQVELPTLAFSQDERVTDLVKIIYLKKVRQELRKMREQTG